MNKFHLYHSLMALTKNGVAKPLLCPDCELEYVCSYSDERPDEPLFVCYSCGTRTTFGIRVWKEIERIVLENIDVTTPAGQA